MGLTETLYRLHGYATGIKHNFDTMETKTKLKLNSPFKGLLAY